MSFLLCFVSVNNQFIGVLDLWPTKISVAVLFFLTQRSDIYDSLMGIKTIPQKNTVKIKIWNVEILMKIYKCSLLEYHGLSYKTSLGVVIKVCPELIYFSL